jgi:hypothetical protein
MPQSFAARLLGQEAGQSQHRVSIRHPGSVKLSILAFSHDDNNCKEKTNRQAVKQEEVDAVDYCKNVEC